MPDPTPPAKRKGLKTISVNGISGGIVSAAPFPPKSADSDPIAAYDDEVETNVIRPLTKVGEFNVTVLDEGQQFATVSGTTATVTIAVSYWDGSTTVTRTLGEQICNVKNVAPGNDVDVQGERKATIVITLEPVGGGARSALALPAGS